MRTFAIALLSSLTVLVASCNGTAKIPSVTYRYKNDALVRLLACQYQVKCAAGVCGAKWRCPSDLLH